MKLRRIVVGFVILSALSIWIWNRSSSKQADTRSVEATLVQQADGAAGDTSGTHDEQVYRFRTDQPRHWKHVMLGIR